MKKRLIFVFSIVCLLVLLLGFQRLVMPKYVTENSVGGMVRDYYENNSENDVIFIGDCEVYSSFVPTRIWEKYGITSYIRGSANQTIWQSYYMLADTLKYEKPRVVVFNVLSMKYGESVKEEYNRLAIDGIKFGKTKIDMIKASITEEESVLSYVFPLLRYHDRIFELGKEDFKYYFKCPEVTYMGYFLNTEVKPYTSLPAKTVLADYTFDEKCYEYLDKITVLCKENGIKLILIKSPTLYPYWYDEWENSIEQYATDNGLDYINFINLELLDYATDTCDGGYHLNLNGAIKLSDYFGKMLVEELGVEKQSKSQKTILRFENMKDKLERQLQ